MKVHTQEVVFDLTLGNLVADYEEKHFPIDD